MQKRNRYLFISTILLLVALGLNFGGALAQDTGNAQVRFVHVIPGASAIDIYTDGQLTISNLEFGDSTGYIDVSASSHQISVTRAGLTTPLWQQDIAPGVNNALTLIAASTNPLNFLVFNDNIAPLATGTARFTAINAMPDGSPVDILLADGRAVATNLAYNQPYGTLDVPAFAYDLVITSAGGGLSSTLASTGTLGLSSGISYVLVVHGAAAAPETLLLASPTESESNFGALRVANAIASNPALDVYVNDALVSPILEFAQASDPLQLPAGSHTIALRVPDTNNAVFSGEFTVAAGQTLTGLALEDDGAITFNTFADNTGAVTPDTAAVNVINAIPGNSSVSLSLQSSGVIGQNIGTGDESGVLTLAPSIQSGSLTITLGGTPTTVDLPPRPFYGGVYYNIFLFDSATSSFQLLIQTTDIAQGIASAPGNNSTTIVQNTTDQPVTQSQSDQVAVVAQAPTPEPVAVAQAVPTADTVSSEVVPAQPTPLPVSQPTGPTARIILDPGANLQLRQYPSADAFSLGLAPSGTILNVIGREGAPALLEGVTPAPEDVWVDPAEDLAEDEDLIPSETWLNVDYLTPDGGVINAWVRSDFLELRDRLGDLMKLAELPTVPGNRPGEARNTDITPPPIQEDRVNAVVINLNQGVNLQMRRTPEIGGESLQLLPNGTVTELLGINEAEEWAFLQYNTPQGGIVTGWSSMNFLRYTFNGRDVDLDELDQRGFLNIIPDDRRGELRAGALPAPLPTVDPLRDAYIAEIVLDPGANLHLRRSPDSSSESLALIPSGSSVIVTARTEDGTWLETSFEGLRGFIASAFVRVTYNGRAVEITEIPVLPPPARDPETETGSGG